MADNASILERIKQQNIQYVNYRFTDPRGKWQHLSYHTSHSEDGRVRWQNFGT
jgi:glutamine synthetase